MKFIKGMVMGSVLAAGTMMMYSESIDSSKKKMIRKGKQMMKKMKF